MEAPPLLAGDPEPEFWSTYREALDLCRSGQTAAAQRLLTGATDDPAARSLADCMAGDPTFRGLFKTAP